MTKKRVPIDTKHTRTRDSKGVNWVSTNGKRWVNQNGKVTYKPPNSINPFVDSLPDTEDDLFEEPEIDPPNDLESDI